MISLWFNTIFLYSDRMPPQLRQEVPRHVRDGLRAAAGGGLRRELHQELLHRVQDDGLRHPRQDLQPEARQELRQTG